MQFSGYVQLTVDLGQGEPFKILSNSPINYDQWHKVIVDRRGHYVTLTVKSEEGVGEIHEDKVTIQNKNFNLEVCLTTTCPYLKF